LYGRIHDIVTGAVKEQRMVLRLKRRMWTVKRVEVRKLRRFESKKKENKML